MNLAAIGYPGYRWPFTKDHAKWGILDDVFDFMSH